MRGARKKKLKKIWSRSWRREKVDYLCSPVRKKRGEKQNGEGAQRGARDISEEFFDAMAPRKKDLEETQEGVQAAMLEEDGQDTENKQCQKIFVTAKSLILAQDER